MIMIEVKIITVVTTKNVIRNILEYIEFTSTHSIPLKYT